MTAESDLVERLRRERDALASELERARAGATFAEAVENSSEAIVVYDADGLLVVCNQNFRDLYGYTAEEARSGVHFAELGRIDVEHGNVVVGDEFGGGEAYLRRKAEYRARLQGSFIVRLKDGRWIKTTDRPMRRGGFVSVQVDVTDIKDHEEELRLAKEQAEEANRLKSEFLANISHDLRTPLNSIIGFSDMILSETWGPVGHDKYREYIDAIKYSGELLLGLVGGILNTARLESGRYRLDETEVDLPSLSRALAATFEPVVAEKGLDLAVETAPGFPASALADERVVAQIVNNLVANACKHTGPGGRVRVQWSLGPGGRVRLTVRDNGPGMPPALVAKVGEPFLQAGAYVAQDGPRGTGLGLFICKRFAEIMGGALEIRSNPDEGTAVTVEWPLTAVAGNRARSG